MKDNPQITPPSVRDLSDFGSQNTESVDSILIVLCGLPLLLLTYAITVITSLSVNINYFSEIFANERLFSLIMYSCFIIFYCLYMGIYYQKIWKEYYYTKEHGWYFVFYEVFLGMISILFYNFFYQWILAFTAAAFIPLYMIKRITRIEYLAAISLYREQSGIPLTVWYEDVYTGGTKEENSEVRKYQTLEALVNSFTKEFLRWGIWFFAVFSNLTFLMYWIYKDSLPKLQLVHPRETDTIGDVSLFVVLVGLWFLILLMFFMFKIFWGVSGIKSVIDKGQPAVFEQKLSLFR